MAEPGTFLGEVARAWHRFWGLSWKWKAPILVVLGIVVLSVIGAAAGGGDDDKTVTASDDSPKATNTTKPADTPKPAETPKPDSTATPVLSLEQQIEKSYRDNRGFMTRASAEGLKVRQVADGVIVIELSPSAIASEGDTLTIAGQSAIVASRAVWGTYPSVQQLQVTVWIGITDQFGAKSNAIGAAIMVDRPTGEKLQYDGLKDRQIVDNKSFFCTADHYFVNIIVFREIVDKGCMAAFGAGKDPEPVIL